MNTTIGIGTRSWSPTHNNIPARLDRTDAASFLNRLAYLTSVGTISQNMRIIDCRNVKRVLNDRRNHGKRLPGNASTSLPAEFTFPPRTSPTRTPCCARRVTATVRVCRTGRRAAGRGSGAAEGGDRPRSMPIMLLCAPFREPLER